MEFYTKKGLLTKPRRLEKSGVSCICFFPVIESWKDVTQRLPRVGKNKKP